NFPKLWEESLRDRALQVTRAKRSPRATGSGAYDALHELHVLEPPDPELLVVLEQRFSQEEELGWPRAGVECIQGRSLSFHQPCEKILQRLASEPAGDLRRWFTVLAHDFHEMLVAQAGRRLDGAEL